MDKGRSGTSEFVRIFCDGLSAVFKQLRQVCYNSLSKYKFGIFDRMPMYITIIAYMVLYCQ